MIISLTDLFSVAGKSRTESVTFDKDRIFDYKVLAFQAGPLRLVHEKDRILNIKGEAEAVLSTRCDRCLKKVETKVSVSLDRKIDAFNMLDEDGETVEFIDHDDLLLDDLLEEAFIENLPMKILCKEDCKGLCETCGKDLNEGPCDCGKTQILTPMQEALMKALNNTDQ